MNGSVATIPLGQAAASVLLGEPRDQTADLAMFQKTSQSFRNLMAGYSDILIAAEPDASVYEELNEAGFKFEKAPIAVDALVFIVNKDNPVNNLTTEQVRKIYSGEITNWKEVGGGDLKIEAFQRNRDSGSQALMVRLVMKDLAMAKPPEEYMLGEVEGFIAGVRSFDGSAAALGYTFYHCADDMELAKGYKILSIDGVRPGDETIAGKTYPFLSPYYAVIAAGEPEDSPARVMYNWLQSPEGQNLIKNEGYVPVGG